MSTARRWIAPAVIAFTAVSLLGSGVSAASDLRADERREAAARAVARAEAAYRDAVRPIVESVFDHAQPLGEADRQFDDDANGGYLAWVDVATDPTAGKALQARRNELAALTAPPSLQALAAKLDTGVKTLQEAAKLYTELPFDPDDDRDLDVPAQVALLRYNSGASTVNGAVLDLFPTDRPAVPIRTDDSAKPVRRPLSHGSYLLDVGRACGRAGARTDALPEDAPTPSVARKAARDQGVILRDLIRAVSAVKAPPADAARLGKEVVAPVKAFVTVAESFDRLSAAIARRDRVALLRALGEIEAADAPADKLVRSFRGYGSEACADYFTS